MSLGILASIVLGYLLGSIPFSYLAGRLRGVDIREHGSGNLGASNTYRVLGARDAVPVLALDVIKGTGAVILAGWLAGQFAWGAPAWCGPAAGLGAICGHIWTVFLRFRGGKGVATAAGVFFGLSPLSTAISLVLWFALVVATKYISVGSMAGAVALPVSLHFLGARHSNEAHGMDPDFWLAVLVAAVVLILHRSNIKRLLEGNENRLTRIRGGTVS